MEFCDISCYLIILAFSTIPFSGIFLTPTNSIYSNCAYYSSNDAGCTSSLKALFDYLSATEFMAFIKLLLPEGKLLQLTAALIHSLNSLLLFTLLDDMLYFIRLYGKYIRRACSAVMTIIFASNSMQIALIKLSTMKSLVFMASMSFLLAASVVAIKFLKARNNNKSFMRCHVLFLATCLFLTLAALIDTKSMTITLIVAGTIAMDKVRQYLPLRWVEKLTFLAILLWSYLFCIRFMQCSLVGDVVRELLVFSKPVSLLHHIISITHMLSAHCHHLSNLIRTLLGAPADRNPECTADKLESLGKILVNLKGTKWMIDMSSILDILAVMAIIVVFCFLRFLWITCRGGYFNYVTFSCIFLPVYMLSSLTSPIVDNIVPGLHALEISMMCYMPSCFLSICLAIALADAWAAPIMRNNSKMGGCLNYIEPIVFKRERRTPSMLEFNCFIARNKVTEESKPLEAVMSQSHDEFQDNVKKASEGSQNFEKHENDGSFLAKGNASLIRAVPARSGLADKAYCLMVFAAATICLETVYCSYNTPPCVAL